MRVFSLLLPVLLSVPSLASVIHVDASARSGGDGQSAETAFQFLQDALAIANDKDEIRIAEGIYFPDEGVGVNDDDPAASFLITKQLSLVGGFQAGQTDGNPDPLNFPTILSGDIDGNDSNSSSLVLSSSNQFGVNSHQVVQILDVEGASLSGLVVTAGNAISAVNDHAGGLFIQQSNVKLTQIYFVGNQAGGRGGALHLDGSVAELLNCRFSGNFASARGGAVGTLNAADVVFTNCVFWGNKSGRGGALNFNASTAELLNCTLSGNHGTVNGGGIQAASSSVVSIFDGIIWNNGAGALGETDLSGSSINLLSGSVSTLSPNSFIENTSGEDPLFLGDFSPTSAPGTGGNLRLSRGSPARDSGGLGANNSNFALDGDDREQGVATDLGAFEATPHALYVDDTAGGANSGTSWTNAFTALQSALAVAEYADEILIAEGLYTPATESDSFEVPADVSLIGGYSDGGGVRDPMIHRSILSGDVSGNDNNADGNSIAETSDDIVEPNAHTVITSVETEFLTTHNVFDGLVITAGLADEATLFDTPASQGGGVRINTGYPVFRDCLFSGNHAYFGGGAVSITGAPSGQLEEDGPVFEGCEFSGNFCNFNGGAVNLSGGRNVIRNCLFDDNTGTQGQAISHLGAGGTLEMVDTIVQNSKQFGVGAAVSLNNTGGNTFRHCLVSGNENVGINLFSSLTMRGCTIAGNGGRPLSKNGSGTSLVVWNSIFHGNGDDYFAQAGGSLAQFHHSLVQGYSGSEAGFAFQGNISATNPGFVSPTSSFSAPSSGGDYRLRADSVALSVGDNDEADSDSDLDGNVRISGHTLDIGCYEFQLADLDRDGISDAFEAAHTTPSSATALDANSDLDNDSLSALQEFAFGTDPNTSNAPFSGYRTEFIKAINQLSIFWTPNSDSIHFIRIIPEHSIDLGQNDPWKETATSFGDQAGELRANTQTVSPLPERQFLRLRVVK